MATSVQKAWDAEIRKRVARVKQGKAKGRPADEVFRDLEDRRRLAAAKKRNAGKRGTPLRQAAKELELDYLDVLEARAKDAGKSCLSHDDVKKRYR